MTTNQLPRPDSKEPALGAGLTGSAFLSLLYSISYFFPGFQDSKAFPAVAIIVAILGPVVTALSIRGQVWSPNSVYNLVNESVKEAEKVLREQMGKRPTIIRTTEDTWEKDK